MQIPAAAATALNMPAALMPGLPNQQMAVAAAQAAAVAAASAPPIATQCFMLSNMFDPAQ